mmetsp:Transcript_47254/g.103026  ORF Transcript_47254/g.103026 Transcript_47254/m.103026 type:complete len:228 (-) Transcript_47254:103-786(-)
MSSLLAPRWAVLDTTTTRAEGAFSSNGSSSPVRAKWPKWFTPNCCSKPSLVSCRWGIAMTPVLFMRTSFFFPYFSAVKRCLKDFTSFRSARSNFRKCTSLLPLAAFTSSTAFCPLTALRVVSTTVAPALAKRSADSRPRPVFPPVISTVLPLIESGFGSNSGGPSMAKRFKPAKNRAVPPKPSATRRGTPPASMASMASTAPRAVRRSRRCGRARAHRAAAAKPPAR